MTVAYQAHSSSGETVGTAGRPLPDLNCPTHPTTNNASEACASAGGRLLTWGTYYNTMNGTIESAFGNVEDGGDGVAGVGPYLCTTCDGGDSGYGYIGVVGESIPSYVSSYTSSTTHPYGNGDDTVGYCPEVTGSGANISCAGLQRTCEEGGFGWLVYAETFDTAGGVYMCAGCDDGATVWGTEEDDTNLAAWPMLMMYGMVAAVLAVALYVDAKVFVAGGKGEISESGTNAPQTEQPVPDEDRRTSGNSYTKRERRSWYLLYLMGYVNFDGERISFCKAVCVNRFKDLWCCRNRMDAGNFVSMLFVTLGVAVLFQDGQLVEYNCYFDSTQAIHNTYERQFEEDFYGQVDAPKAGDPLVYEIATNEVGFWVAEALVVGYQFSIDLLTNGLAEGGYTTRGRALLLMTALSALFCASAMAYEWDRMSGDKLYGLWFIGFGVALFILGPAFSAISHLAAMTLVKAGCLALPRHAPDEGPLENEEGNEIHLPLPVVQRTLEENAVVVQGTPVVVQGASASQ
eukprot:CAMPEP_0183731020 /NCGR_PEP_ID=MMETSP0737-20130205/34125_1 /TAXON_ID=385413 /ORGANISM="Thalassiosira miniscula, Strain CCMP1093" /LENGTH=516 /DNA_ID=CAMNT_0025963643 /DNA_START=157 /DNA_END=1707 /DNA_ORIENTATION=-